MCRKPDRLVLMLLLVGSLAVELRAQPERALGADEIIYNESPEALLVAFRETVAEVAVPDPIPLVRVFGDGRVQVHFPAWDRRAGDWELWLEPAEVKALLSSLLSLGLTSFDPVAVEEAKRTELAAREQAALERGEAPVFFYLADAPISEFELNLTGYRPSGPPGVTYGDLRPRVVWRGLFWDAEKFPQIVELQRLAAAELELRALTEKAGLVRMGG